MAEKDEIVNGEHLKEHVPGSAAPRYVEETDDVLLDAGAAHLEDGVGSGLKLAKDGHVRSITLR